MEDRHLNQMFRPVALERSTSPLRVPGLGSSLAEGHGNPFQYSCIENLTDRGAWWATVHRVTVRHD